MKAVLGRCFVIGRHKFFGADGCDNLTEVEESHVGAFVAGIPDSRHVGLYILFDKRVVVVHVGIGLIKPLTAVFVSSLGSHNAQCADIGPVLLVDAAEQCGVRRIIIGVLETSHIKGLTDGAERQAVVDDFFVF